MLHAKERDEVTFNAHDVILIDLLAQPRVQILSHIGNGKPCHITELLGHDGQIVLVTELVF